ncbi:(d)CMP kinase [bacterium]
MVVTIDGPAGTGKSTIAKRVAESLDFTYIDSGSLYRTCAWSINNSFGVDKKVSNSQIKKLIDTIKIKYIYKNQKAYLYVNNKNVTKYIRSEEISGLTSYYAKNKNIRQFITGLQRQIAEKKNIVLEGRDTGTVVFPDADLKIFLTASIKERAIRRYKEFQNTNSKVNLANIYESIKKRDYNDMTRKYSPLVKPNNAKVINTTKLNINEVVHEVLENYKGIKK